MAKKGKHQENYRKGGRFHCQPFTSGEGNRARNHGVWWAHRTISWVGKIGCRIWQILWDSPDLGANRIASAEWVLFLSSRWGLIFQTLAKNSPNNSLIRPSHFHLNKARFFSMRTLTCKSNDDSGGFGGGEGVLHLFWLVCWNLVLHYIWFRELEMGFWWDDFLEKILKFTESVQRVLFWLILFQSCFWNVWTGDIQNMFVVCCFPADANRKPTALPNLTG